MSMDLVRDVLEHILEQLNCKTKLTSKNMWSLAISTIDKSRLPVLLILDEVDELLSSSDMENVYKLLEWPHQSSNLLMIGKNQKKIFRLYCFDLGIANSLDLTDRLLPRLQLQPEHKPYLLRFSPYNREQMLTIVNDR
jgi:Cdc6-like AAA superfamily ATPase